MTIEQKVQVYSDWYNKIKNDSSFASQLKMPGSAYFINNGEVLAIPRDDGDCRYPYGTDGLNFWTYASGYIHCNEGIFSPFLRAGEGQEPKVAFFAVVTDGQREHTFPLLSVPIMENTINIERYTVFDRCCAYYVTEANNLRFTIRMFVNEERKIIFTILVQNLSSVEQKLMLSSFINPFLMHDITENSENRWFREVSYREADASEALGTFIVRTNEDLSRTKSVSNYGIIKRNTEFENGSKMLSHEETTSRYEYVGGSRGSLHHPLAVKNKSFNKQKHRCAFTEIGIAGDIINLELGRNSSARYDITLDYIIHCNDDKMLDRLICEKVCVDRIDNNLDEICKSDAEKNSGLKIELSDSKNTSLKDKVFNNFIEQLKKQVEFCSLIKGYIQLSPNSLIGIRDVFQALEAFVAWQPGAVRKKMLEALDFTFSNGRCPRQYALPMREDAEPAMDIREFIDQGVWVISTIVTYLKYTGDFSFLDEECGYYDLLDERRGQVRKSEQKDSVLEHMLRIMNYLLDNRDFGNTMCIRALYGDWNDALDGLGVSSDPDKHFGNGVSVMATLQVYQNLQEMEELLLRLDSEKFRTLISEYSQARNDMQEGLLKYAVVRDENDNARIVHGWGEDIKYYVGSFCDTDKKSRYGLTSNAFWVLSKMYDKDVTFKDVILEAFEKLDSKYGLKTFEPHFEPETIGVGRIPKLPAGTAENGAAYIHASIFGIMALFRMGCSELAWEQMVKSLPFTHDYVSCSPFVMPNSYGFNPEKNIDGESMQDWQTGSSNVLLKVLLKYVLGICPEYDGIWVQPAKYYLFSNLKAQIIIKKCIIKLQIEYRGKDSRSFYVNGIKRQGHTDEIMELEKLWIAEDELNHKELSIKVIC